MKTSKKPFLSVVMLFLAVFLTNFSLLPNLSLYAYAEGDLSTEEPTSPDVPDTPNTPDTPDAPDMPDTPDAPDTPDNPPSDAGDEWSGEITEETTQNPSSHTELVVSETTVTYTSPSDDSYVEVRTSSSSQYPAYTSSNQTTASTTDSTDGSVEDPNGAIITTIEKDPGTSVITRYIIDLSDILASYDQDTTAEISEIEVPNTFSSESLNTIRRVLLIILASIGIFTAICLVIWAGINITKLNHTQKIYEEAKAKSEKVKRARITRAAD